MADGIELASAYVTLIPSLKGAQKRIEDELGGVSTDAAGSKIGKGLGESIGSSLDLSSVSQKMQDVGGKLNDVGSKMMGIGAGLTAGVTVPIAGATAAIGGFALKTASAAETTEISFTTMLGSSEAALDMMEELADFAAHTPFELSGLQTATRQLLAYGFTAEDVIPMLTAVGDATAALGTGQAGIESVTRALGQMQTRGKVSAEEMLQLTEAGIPAWEYLARAIGTDTAGAMDAVTKGAVTASEGIDAIVSGMENDFGGMMEEQSKTVEGLFSNLTDAIEQPLMALRETDAYDHFADSLSNVVDSAGPFVESLLPHMEKGLDGAAGLLDKASDAMDSFAAMSEEGQANILGVVAAAAGAGPALTVLGGALRVVGTVGSGLGSIVGKAGEAIGDLSKKSSTASGGVGKLTGGLSLLKGGLVGLGLGAFAVTLGLVADHFAKAAEHERLLSDATMDFDEIAAKAGSTLQGVEVDVEGVLNRMADLNQQTAETMAQLGSDSAMLDGYVGSIERLADQTGLTAAEQYELKNAVEQYNAMTGDTVEVIDAANGKLSKSTDEIIRNADAWRDNAEAQAMQNVATEYLEEQYRIAGQLATAQDELAEAQQNLANAEQLMMENPGDAGYVELYEGAKARVDACQQSVDELQGSYDAAADSAENAGNAAMIAGSKMEQGLKDAVSGLPAEMQGFGVNIATQLSAGIQAGTVSVDAATGFMTGTVDGIVSQLPVSMQPRGAAAAAALANGISSGQINAQQAADILNAVVSGEAQTLPAELQPIAAQASYAFASGLREGETPTFENAQKIAAAAASMDDVGDMYASGYHIVQNLANGMSAARNLAEIAAGGIASAIASPLKASVPKSGPFSGAEKGGFRSGTHIVQNIASGMESQIPLMADTAERVAEAARVDVDQAGIGAWTASGARRSASAAGRDDEALRLLAMLHSDLQAIYGIIPEEEDARSRARRTRKEVAYAV